MEDFVGVWEGWEVQKTEKDGREKSYRKSSPGGEVFSNTA